jgi:hypothetical protein
MLTVETIGRIRREHLLKGKTIKEIARDLKVSRNTVMSGLGLAFAQDRARGGSTPTEKGATTPRRTNRPGAAHRGAPDHG